MLAQIDEDLRQASPVAAVGQELNLVKAHQALAERGYHWLVVRVDNDEAARTAADALKAAGAERAQLYGRFIIEELIEHAADLPQVSESPDRGLDAQTPWAMRRSVQSCAPLRTRTPPLPSRGSERPAGARHADCP